MNYVSDFLKENETTFWMAYFQSDEISWIQETFSIYGRQVKVPRKSVFYGDDGLNYRYTGIDHLGCGWPSELLALKAQIERESGSGFNFCLVNYYGMGLDYMGWHKDNEKSSERLIASLSLGVPRKFRIRLDNETEDLWLENGSLLVFDGYLEHTLPRMKKVNQPRINLTFRTIKT